MDQDLKQFIPLLNNFLEELKKIEQMGCNDYAITELGILLKYVHGFSIRNGLEVFENNIRQTIGKQWYFLDKNKSKPRKRLEDWGGNYQEFSARSHRYHFTNRSNELTCQASYRQALFNVNPQYYENR